MINLTFYLIQSGICLALLYTLYWIFMRDDTFFVLHRIYLLVSILISIVLPLFDIKLFFDRSQSEYFVILKTLEITPDNVALAIHKNYNGFQILTMIYLTGTIFFFLRFLFLTVRMVQLILKYGITKNDGLRFVFISPGNTPFSFFNLIFINWEIKDHERYNEILKHELTHIRQFHSVDLLLMEFLTIIQWFNPFIWFYKNTLKIIHEFLADQSVLKNGTSKSEYQKMLISQAFGAQLISLSNNFNHSLIKRRLVMMSKSRTHRFAYLKMVFVVPFSIAIAILMSISLTERIVAQDKPDKLVVNNSQSLQQNPQDTIFTVVEKMPMFPGGEDARVKYMVENIKYPDEARNKGITGVVFVTFVVEKEGKITSVKVIRGIGGGCDEEAVRVIKNMPNWEPGKQKGEAVRTQFNIPIKFSLGEKTKPDQENNKPKN
jgi:TonB family protein